MVLADSNEPRLDLGDPILRQFCQPVSAIENPVGLEAMRGADRRNVCLEIAHQPLNDRCTQPVLGCEAIPPRRRKAAVRYLPGIEACCDRILDKAFTDPAD